MKKIVLFVAFLSSTLFCLSQELIGGQLNGGQRVNGLISTTPVIENATVEGSPYIIEKFTPAKISASEDNIFYVRYNALRDEFEVKGENDIAYALNKYRRDIVVELIALKKTYQVFGYLDKNGNENFGYFVDLGKDKSNVKLLKKEKIIFTKEKLAVTSYDTAKPAEYKRGNDEYYIKINDANAIELPNGKKNIANLFPKNSKKVLAYIKSEKIKTNREEDLLKLVNYINTL